VESSFRPKTAMAGTRLSSPRLRQGCPGKIFLSRNKALRRLSFVALAGMRDTA
jgi:hypothetical protein